MSPIRCFAPVRLAALGAALASCLLAAGCVSLFPKSDPAMLYRFQAAEPAAGAPARPGDAVIARGPVAFDSAAATDRILTVTGQNAAYIESARWVSPAPILFGEALTRTFQNTPGAPRLVGPASTLRAPLMLSLEVQSFEARYDQGPEAPPEVVVRLRATLVRIQDRSVVGEQMITATKRAVDNRQAPIAQAFEGAVQDALAKLVAWTSGGG